MTKATATLILEELSSHYQIYYYSDLTQDQVADIIIKAYNEACENGFETL